MSAALCPAKPPGLPPGTRVIDFNLSIPCGGFMPNGAKRTLMDADVPPLVHDALGSESVRTHLELGGDDAIFVTPTRTLVYRSEGLLSDESVGEFPHDAERVDVNRGRRKATFELAYVDQTKEFSVPAARADDVLEPLLEGVLAANDVTEDMERVEGVYRFSELTLVVTDGRVIKHIGGALWDEDFEEYPYADVTNLDTEEGSVSTGLVIEVNGRPQRIKIPSEEARVVARAIENAVLAYHEVDSVEALREKQGVTDEVEEQGGNDFDDTGLDPLVSNAPTEPAESSPGTGASEREQRDDRATSATDGDSTGRHEQEEDSDRMRVDSGAVERLETRLEALEAQVEQQSELIERQGDLIDQLVEELRRGR